MSCSSNSIQRKYGSKGKAYAVAGRPPAGKNKENERPSDSQYHLPIRSEPKGKCPHNLGLNVLNEHSEWVIQFIIWHQYSSFQNNLSIH